MLTHFTLSLTELFTTIVIANGKCRKNQIRASHSCYVSCFPPRKRHQTPAGSPHSAPLPPTSIPSAASPLHLRHPLRQPVHLGGGGGRAAVLQWRRSRDTPGGGACGQLGLHSGQRAPRRLTAVLQPGEQSPAGQIVGHASRFVSQYKIISYVEVGRPL